MTELLKNTNLTEPPDSLGSGNGNIAAGLSVGTGFAGMIMVIMPDSKYRSILLLLAPAITILIGKFWDAFTQVVDARIADWRINQQIRSARANYEQLKYAGAEPDVLEKAKKTVEALALLQVEIARKRVEAIATP
jgi:hypothetical protein